MQGTSLRENFVKMTQNPAFWELLAHFWRSVQSSRVQYSVQLQMHGRSTSTSLEKGQSLIRLYASMDPDFFITVLHIPDGPHFSKSDTAMVVPVVAGATPL